MTTSEKWIAAIEDACSQPDWARSNRAVTVLHYRLSEALAGRLGRDGGPNFHTWAVWGSRKAGVTIRQEDLESAIGNATVTAGIVGGAVGVAAGLVAGRGLRWRSDRLAAITGALVGAGTGAWTGRQIAIWSRAKAAELILLGNQVVLRDIGTQTARFLEMLEGGATLKGREAFFVGLCAGSTEQHGQDRLRDAFLAYLKAFDSKDLEEKRVAMIRGNCCVVYHEHIRLEPYIQGSMPMIIRRCATQRMMTYDIGDRTLSVGEDVPGSTGSTAARNWTKIEERMRYVFALFERFHGDVGVFSHPYGGG